MYLFQEDEDEIVQYDPEVYEGDLGPFLAIPPGRADDSEKAIAERTAGELAVNMGDYELAIYKFTDAMTCGPVTAHLLACRADCQIKLLKPYAAISDCNAALELDPHNSVALNLRGKAWRHLGKYEEAKKDISAGQVTNFDPAYGDLQQYLNSKVTGVKSNCPSQTS